MKKRVQLLIVALLLLVAVPNAFAAVNDEQQKTIDAIYQQIVSLQKQLIQIYVDAGEISADQGQTMQNQIDGQRQYNAWGNGAGPFGPVFSGPGFVPPCLQFGWGGSTSNNSNTGAFWGGDDGARLGRPVVLNPELQLPAFSSFGFIPGRNFCHDSPTISSYSFRSGGAKAGPPG